MGGTLFIRVCILLLLCVCSTVLVLAQDASQGPSEEALPLTSQGSVQEAEESVSTGIGDLLRMVLILLLIVVAIYGVIVLIRRSSRAKYESALIKLYSAQVMTGNKMLYLVGVGAHIYFLSVNDNDIQLIAEITDKETKDTIRIQSDANQPAKGSFARILSKMMKSSRAAPEDTETNTEEVEKNMKLFKTQRDKLERM